MKSNLLTFLPSPNVTISYINSQWQVIKPLNTWKVLPVLGDKLSFFKTAFSKSMVYMILDELPFLMRILDISKLATIVVITNENTPLGIPHILSFYLNSKMGLFGFSSIYVSPFLSTIIIHVIFLSTFPFNGVFRCGNSLVMEVTKL